MKKLLLALLFLPVVVARGAFTCDTPTQICTTDPDFASIQQAVTAAGEGWTINVKAGQPPDWANTLTVNKNVSIIGAGPGLTTITDSQNAFILTCKNTGAGLGKRMRLSGMTLIASAGKTNQVTVNGTATINDADFTGGLRIDHVIFQSNPSSFQGGTHCMVFYDGWTEGVVDHCIIDHDIGTFNAECVIVNRAGAPVAGSPAWQWGDYVWGHPYTPAGLHQLFFEDIIFHRSPGGLDTHQVANSSGATYTYRHSTQWGNSGGHEGRSGARQTAMRCAEIYKNLATRDMHTVPDDQDKAFMAVRSGQIIVWGNRYHRFGHKDDSQASSPLALFNYVVSTNTTASAFGGPSGINPWDDNQKGHIPGPINGVAGGFDPEVGYTTADHPGSPPYTTKVTDGVDFDSTKGDVYAHGHGGSVTGTTAMTLTGLGSTYGGPNNKWKDFIVRNLSISNTSGGPSSTVNFGYILTSGPGDSITILRTNAATPSAICDFKITAGDDWEIRRVKNYFMCAGAGDMSIPLDSSKTGVRGALLLNPVPSTPNPRSVQAIAGIAEWDNQYKVSAGATYQYIDPWITGQGIYAYSVGKIYDNAGIDVPTGFSYPTFNRSTPASSSNPNTRVGADDEVWAMAPATNFVKNQVPPDPSVTSIYTPGSGGYTYPHPLVTPPGPTITSAATAAFSAGTKAADCAATPKYNCFNVTTAGFSGTPVAITANVTSVPAGAPAGQLPTNVTLTSGVLSGTANTAVAGDYVMTLSAAHAGDITATQPNFRLTISVPNTPPTCAITKPLDGAVFNTSQTISITATANDLGGSIKTVELKAGSTSINTFTGGGGTYDWTGMSAGTYALTAIATDNGDATTTSNTVNITVNTAPTPTPSPTPALIQVRP